MAESSELLPSSPGKTESLPKSEKFSQKELHPGGGKRLPWERLRVDYLQGDQPIVRRWNHQYGIQADTLALNTAGWREEYIQRQKDIAERVLKRSATRKVSALASRARAGRVFVAKSAREFIKRGDKAFNDISTKELAEIVAIGAKLQDAAEEKEIPQTINTMNVQVNNGANIDPETATALKAWYRSLATGGTDRGEVEPPILGDEARSEG